MKRDNTVYEYWLHFKHHQNCVELILNNTNNMEGYVPIPVASILERCYTNDDEGYSFEQTKKCFIFQILKKIY
ncbi:MAG: hypothetical protein LBR15_00910 [Methanobrevibacter sp.]|nr:hypothetical protein [Candidatus Methanovirga australis]